MHALRMMAGATAFLAIILALVPHVVWALCAIVARLMGRSMPYAPFGYTALGLVTVLLLTMAYGLYIGRFRVQTTHLDYVNADIPQQFDGYRVVHISDLHLSTFADKPKKLEAMVQRINALEPDLICFTGDLVSLNLEELHALGPIVKALKARDGVASVLGNHDFFIYSVRDEDKREQAVNSLAAYQTDTLGWKLLRNGSLRICRQAAENTSAITIVGVDNINGHDQGFRTIAKGDLDKAMQGTEGFRILLSHDPSFWEAKVVPDTDIQLTLSGHTHAAQIRLFGWTPASWMFRQTDGRYDIGNQTLYVNIGLGCTIPMRIGANAEITLITLHSK